MGMGLAGLDGLTPSWFWTDSFQHFLANVAGPNVHPLGPISAVLHLWRASHSGHAAARVARMGSGGSSLMFALGKG